MNYKKMLMVGLAAVAVFSLSGCGTVVKKYTNTELRGEVVSASKLKDSPKVLKALELTKEGKEPWVAKMESAQGVIVSTDMKTFSKGFRLNMVSIKANTVSEIPVQEGDVVDIWMPPFRRHPTQDPQNWSQFLLYVELFVKNRLLITKNASKTPHEVENMALSTKKQGRLLIGNFFVKLRHN